MRTREILTLLFRRKYWMLAVFGLIVGGATLASLLTPPMYEAHSTLLVKFGREYVDRDLAAMSQWPSGRSDLLHSEIGILTSRQLIEQVIADIGVSRLYPELTRRAGHAEAAQHTPTMMDEAVRTFMMRLGASPARDANIVEASFRHPDPRLAAEALQALLQRFQDRRLEIWSEPNTGFLEAQADASRRRLDDAATRLDRFRRTHGLFSLPDQRRLLLQARADLEAGLLDARSERTALEQKTAALQQQLRGVDQTVALYDETDRNVVTDDASGRLLELRLRERELRARYHDDHRLLADVRKDIGVVEEFLARQPEQRRTRVGRNETYDQVHTDAIRTEADRGAVGARASAAASQIAGIDAALRRLDRHSTELDALTREVALADGDYRRSVERLDQARVAAGLDRDKIGSVRMVEAPSVPIRPVWPRLGLNIAGAVVVGALAAVATAVLRDRTQQTFTLPETLEREVGVRVLGSVPRR